jgi:DNA polymerase III subunit epsilon
MLERLSLRLRVFLIFAAWRLGAIALVAGGLGLATAGCPIRTAQGFVQAGVIAGFGALGLVAWVWYLFDLNVAKPIDRLPGRPARPRPCRCDRTRWTRRSPAIWATLPPPPPPPP